MKKATLIATLSGALAGAGLLWGVAQAAAPPPP